MNFLPSDNLLAVIWCGLSRVWSHADQSVAAALERLISCLTRCNGWLLWARAAMKRSKSSLTKEEVERFWRSKKLLVQQHLDEANKDAAISPRMNIARAVGLSDGRYMP